MATPTLLTRDQAKNQYGVDVDSDQGFDFQNKRYNTSQSGQYLYHGDVGGGQIGWYAASSPYNGSTNTSPAPTPTPNPTGQYSGQVDPALQSVKPASGDLKPSPMPYAPSIQLGNTTTNPSGTPGTTISTNPATGETQYTVADDFGTGGYHWNMGTPGAPPSSGLNDAVRARILDLLGTDVNNVSTTDADLAPQSRAFAAAVNREAQAQRAQALEEANAEGTISSGATRGHLGDIGMQAAQAIGANDASLISQKQAQRIDQLKTAISVASSLGMADEANNLQRQLANLQARVTERGQDVTQAGQQLQVQLANLDTASKTYLGQLSAQLQREGYSTQERLAALDAEVRKLGINTQGNLGQLDIALRDVLGKGQLNLGLLSTLLSNNQENNRLGLSIGQLEALLNQNTVGAGLGG